MVDDLNTVESAAAPAAGSGSRGGMGGFLATKTGRIVIGAIVFLVVLAAVVVVLMSTVFSGGEQGSNITVPPAGSVVTTGTTAISEEATPTYRRTKPLTSVFVFRDVFEPTIRAVKPSTGASGTPTSTAGGGDGDDVPDNLPADTLFVRSIATVDGEPVATFFWNGQIYTAGEGEALEGTPWRVISISGDTVVLLFGDSRVTLTVGQGLTK